MSRVVPSGYLDHCNLIKIQSYLSKIFETIAINYLRLIVTLDGKLIL